MTLDHYLYRPDTLPPDRFAAWVRDVHAVIAYLPSGIICGEYGEGDPVLTDERVIFNGNAHTAVRFAGDAVAIYRDPDRLAAHPVVNDWESDNAYPFHVARVFDRHFRRENAQGRLIDNFVTRELPYDCAVVAALILFAHRFIGMCRVVSDYPYEAWRPGLALARETTGLDLYIPFYVRGWSRPRILPTAVFCAWRDDVERVIAAAGVPLAGPDGTGEPILSDDLVALNGVGNAGEEPLRISREYDPADAGIGADEFPYCFIRTMGNAGKQYDVVVAAALLLLADRLPMEEIAHGGGGVPFIGFGVHYGEMAEEEWLPALQLATKATGRTFNLPSGWG